MKINQINKKIILTIFLLISLLILISSCAPGRLGSSEPIQNPDFRKGTQGIVIKVLKEQLPSKITKEESFPFSLYLENRGSADAKATLTVSSLPQINLLTEETKKFTLKGNTIQQPGELSSIYLFNFQNYVVPPNRILTLTANVCYSYETTAVIPVCINPSQNFLSTDPQSCKPTPKVTLSGQGAPITITNVETRVSKNVEGLFDAFINFEVKNRGKGNAYGTLNSCSSKYNFISLQKVSLANYDYPGTVECNPTELDLSKNQQIKCTIKDMELTGSFITPLLITLEYSYSDTEIVNINVQP